MRRRIARAVRGARDGDAKVRPCVRASRDGPGRSRRPSRRAIALFERRARATMKVRPSTGARDRRGIMMGTIASRERARDGGRARARADATADANDAGLRDATIGD